MFKNYILWSCDYVKNFKIRIYEGRKSDYLRVNNIKEWEKYIYLNIFFSLAKVREYVIRRNGFKMPRTRHVNNPFCIVILNDKYLYEYYMREILEK